MLISLAGEVSQRASARIITRDPRVPALRASEHPAMDPLIPIDRFEIFAKDLDHPECCAFDRNGDLWAGGEGGQVYRISPEGAVEQIATLGSFNGGVAFSPAGDLFVCNPASGIVRVKPNGKF